MHWGVWAALAIALQGGEAAPWALLATGSHTYENYRHHADVAHAFHRLVAGNQTPVNQIVSFQYNDVPNDSENPFPGTLFNRPSGKAAGVDVNKGFRRSYTGSQLTKQAILAALTCVNASGPCVQSTTDDDVFIYWAGHGSDGMLLLPNMKSEDALYADELIGALKQMKFKKMVVYVEACDSGSMFEHLPSDLGIYAVTAARKDENSYPIYCCSYFHDECMVAGQDIGTCLGDMFSVAWLEDADSSSPTLLESFENAKKKTAAVGGNPGSTVSQFGDLSFTGEPLTRFIGSASPNGLVPSFASKLGTQTPEVERGNPLQNDVIELMSNLTAILKLNVSDTPLEFGQFQCYRRLNALMDESCAPLLQQRLEHPKHDFSDVFPSYHQNAYKFTKAACKGDGSNEKRARDAILLAC